MTNYEKNKALLDMYVAADIPWGVNKDGKVSECNGCTDCIFRKNILGEVSCRRKRLKWLQQEYIYKEPEIDWSKVKIDTPVLVRDGEDDEWMQEDVWDEIYKQESEGWKSQMMSRFMRKE